MTTSRDTRLKAGRLRRSLLWTFVLLAPGLALLAWLPSALAGGTFNSPNNLLIADQCNNRVIELNDSGRIVWHFGTGSPLPGRHTCVWPQSVQRLYGAKTLVCCGTVPPGTPGYPAEGLVDNRVMVLDRRGRIVWQYGRPGVAGSGPGQLDHPVQALYDEFNGHIFIVDQGNQRVIEVDKQKHAVWQYGTTGVAGAGQDQLDRPASVALTLKDRLLIADQGNDRVIEVTRGKRITWSYGGPGDGSVLNAPASARVDWRSERHLDPRTLHVMIADSGNGRVLRVDRAGRVLQTYRTDARPGSVAQPQPQDMAVVYRSGHVVVSDGLNQQVLEFAVDGTMVWSYGTLGVPGVQWGQLNGPRRIELVPKYGVIGLPLRVRGSG